MAVSKLRRLLDRAESIAGNAARRLPACWPEVAVASMAGLLFSRLVLPLSRDGTRDMVHWDAYDYHLPALAYATDAIRAGVVPLWNPWQNVGFPFFADPQSMLWSPATWVVALLGGYDAATLNAHSWVLVIVAAVGAARLAAAWGLGRAARFFVGSTFALSGFFTGCHAFLGIMTVMALAPWVFASLLHLSKEPFPWRIAVLGLLVGFAGLAGHPATWLVLLLNLALAGGALLIAGRGGSRRRVAAALAEAVLLGGALYAVQGIPALVVGRETTRIHKVPREKMLNVCPLPPWSLVTGLSPRSSTVGDGWHGTDRTMTSVFIGGAGLLALLGTCIRPGGARAVLWGLLMFNILCALGRYGYLRGVVGMLPFYGDFHHSSANFRGFAMLSAALLAGDWLQGLRDRGASPWHAAGIGCVLALGGSIVLLALRARVAAEHPDLSRALMADAPFMAGTALAAGGVAYRMALRPESVAWVSLFLAIASLDLARGTVASWGNVADEASASRWAVERSIEDSGRRHPVLVTDRNPPRRDDRPDRYPNNLSWRTREDRALRNYNPMRLSSVEAATKDEVAVREFLLGPSGRTEVWSAPAPEGPFTRIEGTRLRVLEPNRIILDLPAGTPATGYLFTNEAFHDGWVYRDGQGAWHTSVAGGPHGWLRGMPAATARGSLTMEYRPAVFLPSLGISLAALAAALALLFRPRGSSAAT